MVMTWIAEMRWTAAVAVILLLGGLSGCSGTVRSVGSTHSVSARSDSAAARQTVSFNEATNMAVALSPDGECWVLSIQGTLFKLPFFGGTATALTDYYQDAREPQFSPDARQVVYQGYADGTWDIYSLTLADGAIKQLTSSPFDDREPVFAPDGASVVFSSDRSGNYDIWQLDLQSGQLRKLTDASEDDYSPSFFEGGKEIAFVRHLQRDESELRALNLITQTETPIARETGVISGVSASPNDDSVAYQLLRRDRVGQAHTELKLINSQRQTYTLSKAGADIFPFRAAWSSIENSSGRKRASDAGLFAPANGKLQSFSLPRPPSATRSATRSATQKEQSTSSNVVPFTASLDLNRTPYRRKQRDYGTQSKPALGIVAPALSHTGSQVAFTALGDLWQWDFSTDRLQQLTDDKYAEATPAYSPDDKYIAYVSDRGGTPQLWLHDLADGTHRLLDKNITGVSFPSWSPDGKHLAYFGELPNNPLGGQLMLADLKSASSRTVGAPTSPQPLSWSADGEHLAAAVLTPYSRRYREGIYELLIFNTEGKEAARLNLQPHKSPFDVRLTPDGKGVGYIQGGQLFYQAIDSDFIKVGEPRVISETLADMPAWSGDGKEVLVLAGDELRRFDVATGDALKSSAVPLDYSRKIARGRWTLRTGQLFNGVDPAYQTNIDVIINDNRIEAMVERSPSSPEPVIDVSKYAVIPGLFEMHAHMGNPREPQGRTWLAYGITSVRDPGSNPYLAKERQEVWDSGRRPGPRTHVTGYLTDGSRVFYPIAESLDDDSVGRALARTKALQLDFIKTYVRLPDDQQRRIVEFAHDLGIPTSSHELFPAAANGMDHVEHIGGTSRRGYQPKVTSLGYSYADVLELLVQSNMGITATVVLPAWAVIFTEDKDLFETPAFLNFYGDQSVTAYADFARRFGNGAKTYHKANSELLRQLVERDALLVTGTDSPFVPYGTGLHAELRLFERAGIQPWQVLRAATAKAAQAAGVADELGTLMPGKIADLVVIDGDPLQTIKDADNVVLTVKGGRRFSLEDLLRGISER